MAPNLLREGDLSLAKYEETEQNGLASARDLVVRWIDFHAIFLNDEIIFIFIPLNLYIAYQK